MVTNSDEDDDSSSLEDLDAVLKIEKPKMRDQLPQPVDRGRMGSGKNRLTSKAQKTPNYKYSLAVLVEQQQQLQRSEVDVAQANATLDKRRENPSANGQPAGANGLPNENMIDAVMSRTGDGEEVDRLKEALRRTEALRQDPAWSFFRADFHVDSDNALQSPDLTDHPLQHILHDTKSRQQAFLNGYVEDYAMRDDLPEELLLWILENAYLEPREDLRLSYIKVFADTGSRGDLLSTNIIDRLFRYIGACGEALNLEKPIVPSTAADRGAEDMLRERVPSTLLLIKTLSKTLTPDSRAHAICLLCRLLLDSQVVHDCNVMTALDEALNSLIELAPEISYESELYQSLIKVYGSVTDPRLRLQLVSHLSVYDFRTAVFRRRLALAFFFEDTKYLKIPATEPMIDLNSIAAYLQTPRFRITKKTDYAELASSLALLDIGIDGGDPPLPFATKKDERCFDEAVDRLSMRLKDISSQIVGASALDMRRTEAKDILHAMQRRLTYAVRSQPYVKKSFLADSEADHASEKKGMSDYLDSTKTGVADNPLVDITNR